VSCDGGVHSVASVPITPTRPQLAIYAALAVAVLLIGARFLRSGDGAAALPADVPAFATTTASGTPDGLGAAPTEPAGQLVVDVKGAVRRPGVYRLTAGARAYDAVRRAGGLTGRADRVGVNLAARVVDGGGVVVPERVAGARGATAAAPAAAGSGEPGSAAGGAPLTLDLNTATVQELEQLNGIGPALAANIVAYREQHGGFASVEELDEVSGIGDVRLAAIRAQLGQ
jgi:competence protein ComEA